MGNLQFDKIRRFGCLAYVKIYVTESKFSDRAVKTVLVGYAPTGYVIWHPPLGKFLCSRHIEFNEKVVYKNAYRNSPFDVMKELKGCKDPDVLLDENWLFSFDDGEIAQVEENNIEVVKPKRRRLE